MADGKDGLMDLFDKAGHFDQMGLNEFRLSHCTVRPKDELVSTGEHPALDMVGEFDSMDDTAPDA